VEFSSNHSAIYRKSCAETFPPIFGLFEIFDHNFAKLVAPPSNSNQNYLVRLKRQSMLKKTVSAPSKSTHKPRHNTCSKYVTVERTARRLLSVTKKTPHFRNYSRHALYDLLQTLHGDTARRAHQKGQFHFSIQRIVFRLDALALSVIATATWLGGRLGGWLGGCLSQPVLYQND